MCRCAAIFNFFYHTLTEIQTAQQYEVIRCLSHDHLIFTHSFLLNFVKLITLQSATITVYAFSHFSRLVA